MVSKEDIVEAFDDLGYTLEDDKVIDKLQSFCDLYGVDQTKLSCDYMKFAVKTKFKEPSLDILEQFESEILGEASVNEEKLHDTKVFEAKKKTAKQKSLKDFFTSTSVTKSGCSKRTESPKKLMYCQFCGSQMKHGGAKKTHEFNCMQNPKRRQFDQSPDTSISKESTSKDYFKSAEIKPQKLESTKEKR